MIMRQRVLERVLDIAIPYGTSAVLKKLSYLEAEDRALDSAVENAEFVVQHRSFFIGGKGGVNGFGAALDAVVKFIGLLAAALLQDVSCSRASHPARAPRHGHGDLILSIYKDQG